MLHNSPLTKSEGFGHKNKEENSIIKSNLKKEKS
jgi:hypothetical protein